MDSLASLAIAHLILRLQPINRALRVAVENQRADAERLARPDVSALCVTSDHVQLLLQQIDFVQSGMALYSSPSALTPEELDAEAELRSAASATSLFLPLERMVSELSLTEFETEVILICAAVEFDPKYERIFAFLLDDLNRKLPCLELLTSLTASSLDERIARRHILGCSGQLRRRGILVPVGDAASELRQEFRLAPGVFDFLAGKSKANPRQWQDRFEVAISASSIPPSGINPSEFAHLCDALSQGFVQIVGIWGSDSNGTHELVQGIAAELTIPLRRITCQDLLAPNLDIRAFLQEQLRIAAGLHAIFWLEFESLDDSSNARISQILADTLSRSPVPVVITSTSPWRPASLLRSGSYTEIELSELDHATRETIWSQSFPELAGDEVSKISSRFALSPADIRSISEIARARARVCGDGAPDPVQQHVAAACNVVAQRHSTHFATVVRPRRGPDDLILPPQLHLQILEIASFSQLGARIEADWGFGHLANGSGMKAIFTGEPGTGKTLAAEVIAGILGLSLYKVDLARVVSKWVGETEKNLESAFREAEESHSVLFFDEAEALFGKRAEVQHGTDRYANLEVSYLLQRLESSSGLVILASNVKDQIDSAFTRRFHAAVHFPKPGPEERLRIWKLAFPQSAPLDDSVDIAALARLDMTGAAIVGAARTAALLAADSGSSRITMQHVIRSASRQYRREARVLTPVDLGPYGALLQGAT